jgi:hypothetical protein
VEILGEMVQSTQDCPGHGLIVPEPTPSTILIQRYMSFFPCLFEVKVVNSQVVVLNLILISS